MRVIEFSRERAQPIELFNSVAASSSPLGDGHGEAHFYCLYFGPGSQIGQHVAGFDQLFLVVAGEGWAAGPGEQRIKLMAGQGAYFTCGESHSKGSETGMTVIMVQVAKLRLSAPEITF